MHVDHQPSKPTIPAPRLAIGENVARTMSSREMSELTGKRHDSVKRTIGTLAESDVISYPQIVDGPKAANGVVEKQYLVSKRDSFVVVAQLCPEFTAALVDRWQELEAQQSAPRELTRIELLQIAIDSEQKRIEAEAQRDHAIATKAQIGSKREASAMAKASSAVREVNRLKAELGRNQQHATIIAVERATGERMAKNAFVELRRWCRDNGAVAVDVADARYGTVKAWPADAWMHAYGIDLCALFQSCEVAA